MDLHFTPDQEEIRKTARKFLEKETAKLDFRAAEHNEYGYCNQLWKSISDLGWLNLIIPEIYDGSGLGLLELGILVEELGRIAVVSPFRETAICGALAVGHFGSPTLQQQMLPRIAAGEATVSYAASEMGQPWNPEAPQSRLFIDDDRIKLNGEKIFVNLANTADYFLVVAREESQQNPQLILVDSQSPGITMTELNTVDLERQFKVSFNEVEIPRAQLLNDSKESMNGVSLMEQWMTAARCMEMVGGAQRVLEMSVQYACERKAFGNAIGSFQAVQHHCANMLADILASQLITYEAIWRLDAGKQAAMEVAVAKSFVSDAYHRVTSTGQQLHGAIGFTAEHDLSRYFRHARALELAHGDGSWQRNRVAAYLEI